MGSHFACVLLRSELFPLEFWQHLWGNAKGVQKELTNVQSFNNSGLNEKAEGQISVSPRDEAQKDASRGNRFRKAV
jgi:hypothetical protein